MTMSYETFTQIIDSLYPNITKEIMQREFIKLNSSRSIEMEEVADLLKFFADTSHRHWPLKEILETVNEIFTFVNWRTVFEMVLDNNKKIANVNYIKTLIECWVAVGNQTTFPYDILLTKSRTLSTNNALIFYRIVLENTTDNINFANNIFLTKLITKEIFKTKLKKPIDFDCNLNCAEFFMAVIDHRELIEAIRIKSPEYLLLGLLEYVGMDKYLKETPSDNTGEFLYNLISSTAIMFFEGSTNQFIIHVLFEKYKQKLLLMIDKIDLNLTKTLDILLEHKRLNLSLDTMKPLHMCYDIAILCSRRDHLNLEYWILNNMGDCNTFIDYFYLKVVKMPKEKLFPFNKATIHTIIRSIELRPNIETETTPDTKFKLDQIKTVAIDGVQVADKATLFLSDIIQSNFKIDEAMEKFNELIKVEGSLMGKNILNLLIENYNGLYKLANSEMIASFFGTLVKQGVGASSFNKLAIEQIKKSLSSPTNDREYMFAFKVMEHFYNSYPDKFIELESIDNVRLGLIKKEMIIMDDEPQINADFADIIEFGTKSNATGVRREKIMEHIKNEVITTNKIMYISKYSTATENVKVLKVYSSNEVLSAIFYHLDSESDTLYNFIILQDDYFYKLVVQSAFQILNKIEMFSFTEENSFVNSLGRLIGKIVLRRNLALTLEMFDIKNYIHRSIEYRRMSVCVIFITAMLKQGAKGKIFIPHNPWLMSVLDVLNDLYFCTLYPIRSSISDLFLSMDVELIHRENRKLGGNLGHYNFYALKNLGISQQDSVSLKKTLSIALDFSTRETATKVIKGFIKTVHIILNSAYRTLIKDPRNKGVEEQIFNNLAINTLSSLMKASILDILKNTIYSNIIHFFKLSLNSLNDEVIFQIIQDNVATCSELVEKVGITKLNETLAVVYRETKNSLEKDRLTQGIAGGKQNKLGTTWDFVKARLLNKGKGPMSVTLLMTPPFSEKKSLRKIENAEYQDIRSFLIQLGRKIPVKKRNYIHDEFPSILGENKYVNFKRIIMYLENTSTAKDEDALALTKYLMGHALKSGCKDTFIFDFLHKIFLISNKTKKETVNWLIYSEDESKNIALIKKFIEYNFIFIEEYDQALSRLIIKDPAGEYLLFALKLLKNLLLGDKLYCNIYNFIYTIEAISKRSDYNAECFEFLKEIEHCMMDFNVDPAERNTFDEFIGSLGFTQPGSGMLSSYKARYKTDELNFKSAIKSSWNHFVLYSGNYKYFKVDILAQLIRSNDIRFIHLSLDFLAQAYRKKMYLFNEFYCRFFTQWIGSLNPADGTMRGVVMKILDIIAPSVIPAFSAQFIEIISHSYFNSCTDAETMWKAIEILKTLDYNEKYEKMVYDYLLSKELFVKKYAGYLINGCPSYCVNLLNFLDSFIKGNDNRIDSRSKNGCLFMLTRYHTLNPPETIKKIYDETIRTQPKLVNEYEARYFKIKQE